MIPLSLSPLPRTLSTILPFLPSSETENETNPGNEITKHSLTNTPIITLASEGLTTTRRYCC